MPLYMDVHTMGGVVTAADVATAHMADLQTQNKYDVRYLRCWVDEQREGVLSGRGTLRGGSGNRSSAGGTGRR